MLFRSARLQPAWVFSTGSNNGHESAPLVNNGVMFVSTPGNQVIALDARTGRRLWHFQTIHHDLWDLDNVSAPQLVTVTHDGRKVDVVAHAGKTGFLYVFNRVTGEPLWPIEERAVPVSDVPGETASPTQPIPTRPAPFARQGFSADDVMAFTPALRRAALDEKIGRAHV